MKINFQTLEDLINKIHLKPIQKIFASIIILLFIAFIWPTCYRYDKVDNGSVKLLVRTNRFTGKSEFYHPNKSTWVKQEEPKEEPKEIKIPYYDLQNVTGNVKLGINELYNQPVLALNLYNGTQYYLNKVVVQLKVYNKDGSERWSRLFEGQIYPKLNPMTTSNIFININDIENIKNFEWTIEELYGYTEDF